MNALTEFRAALTATLADLSTAGLLRRLRLPQGIDLVSNDYLGLAEHPHLTACMGAALARGVSGSGGSRLLRGHHAVFDRIEERLAAFSGTEAALLFGSGYAANIGLLQAIAGPDDLVVSDERNHASIIDGIRLTRARTVVYPHQDLDAVDTALTAPRRGRAIVITESVFSMDGDLTPLSDLVSIAERHGAAVIVDEAHATGLYGARGSGRVEELGLRDAVLATIHTGGKALGSTGAWVAGPGVVRDVLINRARTFIFSTAPQPLLAAALGGGLDLVEDEPLRRLEVHRKAALLRNTLQDAGVQAGGASPIVPILAGSNDDAVALQDDLTAQGFDVRAIRPPSVAPGTARLRVTVRYPIADRELQRFATAAGNLLHSYAR
ncbi:MAG: 8-amino-7-oxononanoate synthase [Acidobacteria bacterium]|nr:8-amino-7-oxononanoate synthase [Acidobacteriota bacterium]